MSPTSCMRCPATRTEMFRSPCTAWRRDWKAIRPRASRSPGASIPAGKALLSNVCWTPNPGSGPPSYEMRLPRSSGESVAQGKEAAEQERRRLGIASAQNADVSELTASQGIRASGVALPDRISGLFLRHPSIGLAAGTISETRVTSPEEPGVPPANQRREGVIHTRSVPRTDRVQKTTFIISRDTTRKSTVMIPPVRMKSATL